jgi:CubicO group peptidase (beta-lactamase class C family)
MAISPSVNPERLQVAYEVLRDAVATGELPSGLLAVATARETVRCEAFGPDGPIATDGIYSLMSVTKPIVATAVLQLVERGRLLIESPVARYMPEFAVNGKQSVTVWHLLTHTSGLNDSYLAAAGLPEDRFPTPEQDLAAVCATYVRFAPGTRYEYCNSAFRILGELISRQSGTPYTDYLRERVLAPAGMVDTSFSPEPAKQGRLMPVHAWEESFRAGLDGWMALAAPAGGLFGTVADLVAFGQTMLNGGVGRHGRVLSPAAVRTMTRLQTEGIPDHATGEAAYYALGWGKEPSRTGRLVSPSGFGHGGWTGTHLWVEPDLDLVLVFLTNRLGVEGRVRTAVFNAAMASLE